MPEVQRYLDWGFSVIPLRWGTKRPALDSWNEFQSRRPTPDEVQKWWGDGHQHGVAIVCGQVSGIVVLDIDDPEKFGVALQTIGETLPDTPIVRTRKGWHLYFQYPPNRIVRRHDRLNDWGAELRGDGCYVVAPPSVVEGHRYHWAKRNDKRMALGEVPLAECPEWLLDAFGVPFVDGQSEQKTVQPSTQQVPQPTDGKGDTLSDEQKRALKSVLVSHWIKGKRHELALGLAGLLAKSGIAQDDALALLCEIASQASDDEWRDRERALKDSFDRLWTGKEVVGYKRLEEIVGEQTAQLIAAIVSPRKTDNEAASRRQTIRLLTLNEWDERLAHIAQGHWLVEGLLQAGWLLVINARPKVGKSIVSVNLATALAEGTPFLNLPTSPCAVVYIDLERPLETLNRFKVLNAVSNSNIFVPAERIGADMLEALRELVKQAHDLTNRPVAVFIDTLGDFLKPALRQRKASINDYDAIAEILQALRDLALELSCAFVFVHHTRKAQSEEPTEVDVLGSTAIAGKFDVIAHLQPNRTDASVLALTVEGNAIAKTTLHFAIGDEFRITPCEPPAKTKEEQAAREIRRLLERHSEGLQRSELIRYLLDIGLAETEDGAMRLFHRAIKLLPIEAKRSGQRTVYVLTGERLIPTEPTEGKSDKRDTYREFVTLVTHPEKPQQNKAKKEVTSDCLSCHSSPENSDNSDNSDNIGLSHMSRLSPIASEDSDKPLPRCHTSCHSQNASKIRASAECVTTVTNPIPMSHLSHIQSPELPEPYATLRDDELVDAETLIAELTASPTEPTDEPVTLVTLRAETSPIKSDTAEVFDQRVTNVTNVTPQPVNTPSDIEVAPEKSENGLQQTEKFVDTEKWLDELCAELGAPQSEPTETEPTDIEVLVWQCERCGRVFERLVEADLFGSPKCRVCGGTLKICWQRSDKP